MASHHSSHHHSNNASSASSSGRDNVPTKAASAALEAAQWSHKGRQGIGNQYSHDDIERMAEYSASMYAKSSSDKAHYLEYYRNYYKNGGDPNAGAKSAARQRSSPTPSEDERPPGASAASTSPEREKVIVNGREYPRYPTPDVSTYTFDEGTGYYYDASTQLYYDSNSQYYLNAKNNKYVYWSPDHHTFLPAPETTSDAATDAANEYKEQLAAANGNGTEKKKDPPEKKDKVKTAKRIAKDMEKWAKTLNQKAAKAQQQPQQSQLQQQMSQPQAQAISIGVSSAAPGPQAMSISAAQGGLAKSNTEDLAFSMLQNKNERERSVAPKSPSGGLARLTGYGSDDNEDEDNSAGGASGGVDDQQFTDLSKLACLLCKRAFPSRDKLMK